MLSSLFSEICESIKLTKRSLTMKSSALVTSANRRLLISSISLTIDTRFFDFVAMSLRWSSVMSVRASAWATSRSSE
jgi:hypothetical protein